MTWETESKWFAIAIIGWIAGSIALRAITAIRAHRFGVKYVKLKDAMGAVIVLGMGVLFCYGWFRYPDGPLHPCTGPTGYCGKQGQPHTFAEYQAFELWQTTLFVVWPVGMLALFLLNRKKSRRGADSSSRDEPGN